MVLENSVSQRLSVVASCVGRPDVVDHVLKCGRTLLATCLPLHWDRQGGVRCDIVVEHLTCLRVTRRQVGVEVRAVGRHVDEADLGRVFVDTLLCLLGVADRMWIHDQEDLSIGLPLECQ